jgi:hypothetical protein
MVILLSSLQTFFGSSGETQVLDTALEISFIINLTLEDVLLFKIYFIPMSHLIYIIFPAYVPLIVRYIFKKPNTFGASNTHITCFFHKRIALYSTLDDHGFS